MLHVHLFSETKYYKIKYYCAHENNWNETWVGLLNSQLYHLWTFKNKFNKNYLYIISSIPVYVMYILLRIRVDTCIDYDEFVGRKNVDHPQNGAMLGTI